MPATCINGGLQAFTAFAKIRAINNSPVPIVGKDFMILIYYVDRILKKALAFHSSFNDVVQDKAGAAKKEHH